MGGATEESNTKAITAGGECRGDGVGGPKQQVGGEQEEISAREVRGSVENDPRVVGVGTTLSHMRLGVISHG